MNKKNITFFIESLSNGGAERVTSVLANELYYNNYTVNLIVLNKKKNEYFLDNNINKFYIKKEISSFRIVRVLRRIININNLINKLGSDVIISLSMPSTNLNLIISLIARRKRVVLSERNDPNSFPKSKLSRIVRNLTYKLSDALVFQTNDAKNYFSKSIREKGIIIPNPIIERLPDLYQGERKKEIVNFCRLDEQKNLTMLIDSFAKIKKEYPDYSLSIYGEGELKNKLITYVNNHRIKDVYFHGHSTDIHNRIKDCAMFVSSSDYEGISNSMLESLAIGLPTICTDCPIGGARMFIQPYKNGLLVPIGDTNTLYSAMKLLIENQDLSKNIARNAVRIREELSISNIIVKWIDIIES